MTTPSSSPFTAPSPPARSDKPATAAPATEPDDTPPDLEFNDLFDREDIQKLQDQFALATGVASVITRPDGTPLTRPSNFTRLCADIIRRTETGRCNCFRSDAVLGRCHAPGPIVQPCLSGGLWDAGTSIVVGGRHIANWLIGQVRNEAQDDAQMRLYAQTIGADEEAFMQAYREVPGMSRERFQAVAEMLATLAQQLSASAFLNARQSRIIAARERAEEALRTGEARLRATIEHTGAGYFRVDPQQCYEAVNRAWLRMHGFTSATQILGRPFTTTQPPQHQAMATRILRQGLAGFDLLSGESFHLLADGSTGSHTFSLHPVRRGGKVVAVEGFLIDTTSQRRAASDYKMLFDTMLDGFALHEVMTDVAGQPVDARYVAVNPAFERLTGLPAANVIGRTVLQIFPAIEPIWMDAFRRVASTGQPEAFESHSTLLNRFIAVTLFRPSAGRVASVITDVTARKLAEIELRKLSRAVEQSPAMVMITDLSGAIDYINPSFTTITGYTLDELRGLTPRVLGSGEKSAADYQQMWQTISAGREWRGEFRNRRKNGDVFWVSSTIGPIFGDEGRIAHYLAVNEDITERKRAEAQIREQAALLDVAQDAILVTNLDRQVTYWNQSAALLYDIPPDAAGKEIEELTTKDPQTDYAAQWQGLLQRREWTGERRVHTHAGRVIDVRLRARVFPSPPARATAVMFVITDITESKQLEAQFLRAQRLESLGALASGVAHDLNNILTPILISAEMLRPLAVDPEDHRTLQLLNDSARRGADIVQQLLLFGRGSDSPRSPLSVGGTIKEVGKMMRGTFPKNIVLSIQAPADLWLVEADRTQLHQVVLNLCVNARDAMPQGGRLTAVAENVQVDEAFSRRHGGERTGPHVRLQIMDTGTGIAPEHLEKIFDPFFTTKPAGQGTGLGLATVLGIIRSHQGFLDVHSVVGKGTTFDLYLPAATSSVATAVGDADGRPPLGQDELILLVEDEENIRSMLQRALNQHRYRVLVASDGAEALGVFAGHAAEVKLVITNVSMPVMDGARMVRELRRLDPKLPVIAMSGLSTHREEFAREFGSTLSFLAKPFEPDYALRLVRTALDAAPPPRELSAG